MADNDNMSRRGFLGGSLFNRSESESTDDQPDSSTDSEVPARSDPQARQNSRQNTPETRGPAVDLSAILDRARAINGADNPGDRIQRNDTQGSSQSRAPVLRPPGARPEAEFMERCTRCGDCADACPYGTVTLLPERFDDLAGTPSVSLHDAPCHMCQDVPCIKSCEPDALEFRPPVKIGVASIQTHSCLAHNRNTCSVCVERCPKPGAIKLEDGVPVVDEDVCSGCGVCFSACPAPGNAIVIEVHPLRVETSPAESA